MPYPSKRFPSAAAVPSSPMGDAFSPVQAAAAGRRRGCEPRLPTPLASAGLKALLRCRSPGAGCCRQRSCPDASLGFVLERAGGRCFRELRTDKPRESRDRNRSPGRTRVHTVFRPSSDLDGGAAGPRVIRRILWGSASPGRTSPPRSEEPVGWDPLRRRGVAAPRLDQRAAKQPAAPGRPKIAFSFPESQVCAACPTRIGRSNREGSDR
jgi:hypothetical protein